MDNCRPAPFERGHFRCTRLLTTSVFLFAAILVAGFGGSAVWATDAPPIDRDAQDRTVLILLALFVFLLVAFAWAMSRWMGKDQTEQRDDWMVPLGLERDEFDEDER